VIKLGLIGDNIAASKAPLLHETAGRLSGVEVTYDRLVPKDMGLSFDDVFEYVRDSGYRGVNVTYPYKELAARKVHVDDTLVHAIGAVNTVVFETDGPRGFNTDYSGFMWAYRAARGDAPAGTACLIGAGGVGKAVAFGLVGLGAKSIHIVDVNTDKAEGVSRRLAALNSGVQIEIFDNAPAATKGVDGVLNCTPLGMVGVGGSPIPKKAMQRVSWAFDAVYTPLKTPFLKDAASAGLSIIPGYELFFGQGVDAWELFTGLNLDTAALREAIERQ
jgi:shikimate dehydrogenase